MIKLIALLTVCIAVACGAPSASVLDHPMLDGRIVGGVNTTIEEYPYIASVQRLDTHICGGGIVRTNPAWIITAAHCVVEGAVRSYSARVGSSLRNSGGETITVARILIHESYDSLRADYDIALVQLVSGITIANAEAIPLAHAQTTLFPGEIATITGWGTTSEGGVAATVLQVVQVPIVSQSDCRLAYGASYITDRMFCAGVLGVGGLDACQGDSGGPVVVDGLFTGIVSWGTGCARPEHPGVKTSIPAVRTWITDAIGV